MLRGGSLHNSDFPPAVAQDGRSTCRPAAGVCPSPSRGPRGARRRDQIPHGGEQSGSAKGLGSRAFSALLFPLKSITQTFFFCNSLCVCSSVQTRWRPRPPSPSRAHSHSSGHEGGGLVGDAVQPDLRGRLLRLHRGGHHRRRRVLHPRVVEDVLEGRAVSGSQR